MSFSTYCVQVEVSQRVLQPVKVFPDGDLCLQPWRKAQPEMFLNKHLQRPSLNRSLLCGGVDEVTHRNWIKRILTKRQINDAFWFWNLVYSENRKAVLLNILCCSLLCFICIYLDIPILTYLYLHNGHLFEYLIFFCIAMNHISW